MHPLLKWIPHFRTEYLAVFPSGCPCGKCQVAMRIPRHDMDEYELVLKLQGFAVFGRTWRPRVTRIP